MSEPRRKRRPLAADEFIARCHYSRTGWAIWKREGTRTYCTCRSIKPTKIELAALISLEAGPPP